MLDFLPLVFLPTVWLFLFSYSFVMNTELFLSMMEVLHGLSRGGTEVSIRMVSGVYALDFSRGGDCGETFDRFVKWLYLTPEISWEFDEMISPYAIVVRA